MTLPTNPFNEVGKHINTDLYDLLNNMVKSLKNDGEMIENIDQKLKGVNQRIEDIVSNQILKIDHSNFRETDCKEIKNLIHIVNKYNNSILRCYKNTTEKAGLTEKQQAISQSLISEQKFLSNLSSQLEQKSDSLLMELVPLKDSVEEMEDELLKFYSEEQEKNIENFNSSCVRVESNINEIVSKLKEMPEGSEKDKLLTDLGRYRDEILIHLQRSVLDRESGAGIPKEGIDSLQRACKTVERFKLQGDDKEYFQLRQKLKDRILNSFRELLREILFEKKALSKLFNMASKKTRYPKNVESLKRKKQELSKLLTEDLSEKIINRRVRYLREAGFNAQIPEDKEENRLISQHLDRNVDPSQKKNIMHAHKNFSERQKIFKMIASIESLCKEIESYEVDQRKGIETRENFRRLGGEEVAISIPSEKTVLSGSYISADGFRSRIKAAGGKKITFSIPTDESASQEEGIAIPESSDILKLLESLGIDRNKGGCGFQLKRMSRPNDSYFILISDKAIERLRSAGNFNHQLSELDTDSPVDGGTVVVTSGNAGVYEMHKGEMLFFLLNGMNVMGFNFRGHGESTGEASGYGLKQDFNAVYEYLTTRHSVRDEKLLLKALCMSGGPAASLAAQHPRVNLFMDQTYADFETVMADKIDNEIEKTLKLKNLKPEEKAKLKTKLRFWAKNELSHLASMAALLFSPGWRTAKDLEKVEGHIGVLFSKEDDVMPFMKHTEKIYNALSKAESKNIYDIPGKHGTSWINVNDRRYGAIGIEHMDHFLARSGLRGSF